MNIELNYSDQKIPVSIPSQNLQSILLPNNISEQSTDINEVERAISNPIDSDRLKDIVAKGEKVCIVTSDITRPMPSHKVLPLVMDELKKADIPDEDIAIVFALGNHRKHTQEEKIKLVGQDIYRRVRCIDSDQSRVVHLGTTSRGTPVDIFETVANADRVICLGNIEYHYFAGYSGGLKALMPGVSTATAIAHNHSMMVEKTSVAGKLEGNNLRADIDEVAKFVKVDFIVNVILDEKKNIVKAVAGNHVTAHRNGCEYLDNLYKVNIESKADIVLVSAGGFPKDINLYQAQKALDNAKHAVKKNGIIILCAACREGLGEEVFKRWITGASSPHAMVERIQKHFELGGHKAAAIGMVQSMCDVYLVSDMDSRFVESMFFIPHNNIQEAVDCALKEKGNKASIIVMPFAGSTLPKLTN